MNRVELDKAGNWADLKDVEEIRDGDRKRVNRAVKMQVDEDNRPVLRGGIEDDMRDALLTGIVENWNLPIPLPKDDPESLDKLTIEQGKNLREAVEPYMDLVRDKAVPVKANPVPTDA